MTVAYECTYEYPGVPTETELMVVTGGNGWYAKQEIEQLMGDIRN